ncbi:MAG: DUF389 domain-containing protein [Gemmatimonadota bacterium]
MGEDEKPLGEAVEEVAAEKLGVSRWDRPAIFRDSAEAAVDNRLPFWAVLVLSGAIATLGLAINSSAVVIGAMLVAPLLAPVMGLALALAAGDARLAIQTAAVVAGSTVAVVLAGALLTTVLPFQTITLEITSRARPSTLDLAVAIFSGLVGAVVLVARGSRLSAALPGVAISVALIPPLAVAGFGIAADFNGELIYGSMLLYGANLAGIVLSGMGVFLLVGMHRPDVIETALQWHREAEPHGLAAAADRMRWVRQLEMLQSTWARSGLVIAFVVALGIPLSETLTQITREARVQRATSIASEQFRLEGRSSIVSREIVYGNAQSVVHLRIATTEWLDGEVREDFERLASAAAREPIRLVLEQLPASAGDIEEFARLLPGNAPDGPSVAEPTGELTDLLSLIRLRLDEASDALVLPDSTSIVRLELANSQDGRATVRALYAAPGPLTEQAREMLAAQLARELDIPDLQIQLTHLSTALRTLGSPPDSLQLQEFAALLQENDQLQLHLLLPVGTDSAAVAAAIDRLVQRGVPRDRMTIRFDPAAEAEGVRAAIRPATEPELPGAPRAEDTTDP